MTAAVLSIYSFISPLLTDRAGLPARWVPVALVLFGVAALIGAIVGGRVGDRRPFATPLTTAALTVIAAAGLCAFSTLPAPTLVFFTLLGLAGLSANPILVNLAVRYGGHAPTLASAMATSIFNLGTAIGTWFTGLALASGLDTLAPPVVGVTFAVLMLLPLTGLAVTERRAGSPPRATCERHA